ncbi:MAG: flagellar hook-basal body complex protein FliE [Planctomycetes bacterium]|nr:flagellar hook-basal body complex protein FliE [Planctomycetota bacterium]
MPAPITGPAGPVPLPSVAPLKGHSAGAVRFEDLLVDALRQTNQTQLTADESIERYLAGDDLTQVEVFSAVRKADLSLRMLLQIRNKLVEAWNEIQQLRI